MDEAGSRVHLANIHVPKEIVDLEGEIEKIKQSKNQVVKNQNFEEAARLRDLEKKLPERPRDRETRVGAEGPGHGARRHRRAHGRRRRDDDRAFR